MIDKKFLASQIERFSTLNYFSTLLDGGLNELAKAIRESCQTEEQVKILCDDLCGREDVPTPREIHAAAHRIFREKPYEAPWERKDAPSCDCNDGWVVVVAYRDGERVEGLKACPKCNVVVKA